MTKEQKDLMEMIADKKRRNLPKRLVSKVLKQWNDLGISLEEKVKNNEEYIQKSYDDLRSCSNDLFEAIEAKNLAEESSKKTSQLLLKAVEEKKELESINRDLNEMLTECKDQLVKGARDIRELTNIIEGTTKSNEKLRYLCYHAPFFLRLKFLFTGILEG